MLLLKIEKHSPESRALAGRFGRPSHPLVGSGCRSGFINKRNDGHFVPGCDQSPKGAALLQRVTRCALQLLDQIQIKFGSLLCFAAATFLDQMVAGHIWSTNTSSPDSGLTSARISVRTRGLKR